MWLSLTILAALTIGWELVARLWKEDDAERPGIAERILYALLIGTALWQASTWAVALAQLLVRPLLLVRTAAFVVIAVTMLVLRLRRRGVVPRLEVNAVEATSAVLIALPILLWTEFVLWRGKVVPPADIDGLSYHLPRAVLFLRSGGYDPLLAARPLIGWRPANYELLLADAIALGGGDGITEWISTLFYLCFIVGAIAVGERWWGGNRMAAAVTALVTGSIPVLLLHAGAFKNDVMTAFYMTAALVALGRCLVRFDVRPFCLAIVALAACGGTKLSAPVFVLCVLPALLLVLVRGRLELRSHIVRIAVVAFFSFLLLGGAAYVDRLRNPDPPLPGAVSMVNTVTSYGYFHNLWKGPYVLLAESFSSDPRTVWVPWASRRWVTHRYELYYSELGIVFSLCALAVPFCMYGFRRRMSREAYIVTAVAVLSVAAILPFDGPPFGRYLLTMPRFALILTPIVFGWTISPLVDWLGRYRRGPVALVCAASAAFVIYAWKNASKDVFLPFGYVLSARENPAKRLPPLGYGRAAAVIDEMAGPTERVAFHGGVSSLIHLAFGANLQRPVEVIQPAIGPPAFAENVRWVGIDQGWSIIWGNPDFKDVADARRFIARGQPTTEDLRVATALANDPRFELVWSRPSALQAVFRRR